MSLMDHATPLTPAATPAPAASPATPATPATPAATPAPADTPAAPTGDKKDFAVARPEHVPEKFWDPEKSEVRTDDVLKSYGEMERALTEAKKPKVAPEQYDYKVPEDITKEFGLDSLDAEDHYLKNFQTFAKENGLSQEDHDKYVNFYIKMELEYARATQQVEFAKLGDEKTATARINALHNFATTKLDESERAIMSSLAKTEGAVKLFEKFITMSSSQRQLADANPDTIYRNLTQKDVDVMMEDERYTNKKHPEYSSWNAKVTEAYDRLYPAKKG